MTTKQITSSTLWQIASQITMAALSVVTVKFVAIGLTKELAGEYNTAYGFLQIFGILADFGLYAVAVREVSKAKGQEREHIFGTIFALRLITLALSLATALLFVWVLPAWRGTPLPIAVTIASLVPFFTLLAGMIRTAFQVHYRMHYVFIAEVSQRILTVSLIGILIALGLRESSDVRMLYAFLLFGGLGASLLFVFSFLYGRRMMRIWPHWDKTMMKHYALQAAPFGLAFLCTALYRQSDVTLIGMLRPDYAIQNAYYGFVQRAMDMAYLFPTFLLNSTLPILSERAASGHDTKSLLGKTFHIIVLLGTTLFLFAFLWSRPLMLLLTSDRYMSTLEHAGSDTALHLLAISMFLNGIVLFCFYALLTRHQWRPLVWTLFVGSVVSVTANLLMIPALGFVGACYSSIITHFFLAIILLPQTLKRMPITYPLLFATQWAGYATILGGGLFLMAPFLTSDLHTAIGIAIAGLFAVLILWLGGIVRSVRG